MTPDQIITTHYGKMTSVEIGRMIGKSDACVRARAQKLGLVPKRATVGLPPIRLSNEDKRRVHELWPLHSLRDVARIMRRCPKVIRRYADAAGLPAKRTSLNNVRAMKPSGQKITKLPQLQQPPIFDFSDAVDLDTEPAPRMRTVPLPPITPERIHARHQIEAVYEERKLAPDELRCICGRPGAVHCAEHKQLLQREGVL